MPLSITECTQFANYLGTRPYNWDARIAKDRKPNSYLYAGMYKTSSWESFTGTTHLHERTYVTRPNDPGLWPQFVADPCVGAPCDVNRKFLGYGVDQIRYDRYRQNYQSPVFCIDQLNTVEQGIAKLASIAEGLQSLPESIASDFLRTLTLRKSGTTAQGAGLFLAGAKDSSGNPVSIDIDDTMFAVSQGQSLVGSTNTLMINLNANGALTALGLTTTALLIAAMGQLSMEYLANIQMDLAANGYHNREWMPAGKFSITVDPDTRRKLLVANPALSAMYHAADFAKGGSFYSYGMTAGAGDWLFKEDLQQMRFRFRGDLDGKNFSGGSVSGAIWIEQVQPYQNVAATYGLKPVYSTDWKNAPIRMYHAYNRDAREIFVGDVTSVNPDMKFGLARSFMGKWKWYSPDYFKATDPNTGVVCEYQNDTKSKGYFLGEFDLAEKTVYPEIERVVLALGEPQQYVRTPNTVTPLTAPVAGDYQTLLPYNSGCSAAWTLPPED